MDLSTLTLLKLEVFQSHAFLVGRHLTLQLADVDAGNGVLSRTLTQPAVHRSVLDAVNGQLKVSPYIEVSHVEESTLGLVGILARAVVVGLIVDTVQVQQPFSVLFVVFYLGNRQIVAHQLSFLVLAFPLPPQSFYLTFIMSVARLDEFQFTE